MDKIVVGIDGSPGADQALRWAIDEARQWNAELDVVIAWSYLDQHTPEFKPDYDETDVRTNVDAALARVGGADGVNIVVSPVNDLPARAILDRAVEADLVVVGSRGLGGFKGLLLGSVSHQVVSHSRTPVVIVHPEDDVR